MPRYENQSQIPELLSKYIVILSWPLICLTKV